MATMKLAWPGLTPETRHWLIVNNGQPVPSVIVTQIMRALGFYTSTAWFDESLNPNVELPSDEVAWIREIATRGPEGQPVTGSGSARKSARPHPDHG